MHIIGKNMPILTTKLLGNTNDADPKPVTGFDYAGQPMKPGGHYNGRPEHMGRTTEDTQREHIKNQRLTNMRSGIGKLTKAEISARIKAGHARAKAAGKIFGFAAMRRAKQERETQA
jgi:hypothetical protein